MQLDSLTIGELKQIKSLFSETDHPYKIGQPYLIRTVTMIISGRLKAVYTQELVIEEAAWIADTGRFSNALTDVSVLEEVEPFPSGEVIVGRGSVIDAVVPKWTTLPRDVK